MRSKTENIFYNIDWSITGLYILLVLLGWLNLYSASYNDEHPYILDQSQEYGKQFTWIVVSFVLAIVILVTEGGFYSTFAYYIYGLVSIMLIAVLLFGTVKNGARSWFGVGGFGIQPSEFAKFATALAISRYLSTRDRFAKSKYKLMAAGIIVLPALLILLQPDAGTVLVFFSFVFVLYLEGLSGNILLLALLGVVMSVVSLLLKDTTLEGFGVAISGQIILMGFLVLIGIAGGWVIRSYVYPRRRKRAYLNLMASVGISIGFIFVVNLSFTHLLKQHQRDRIEILLGLKFDKDKGYNVHQAMAAIGSGGWTGKGYQKGTLSNNKFKHVPMQSTDFIFCSVGEEWGFMGTSVLIILFLTLLIRLVMVAERQRSKFTRLYGYSVACILFYHLMINVGMTIGLAPVIGIPLPFFSYGGSSLLGFTILLFIFVKLDSERLEVLR